MENRLWWKILSGSLFITFFLIEIICIIIQLVGIVFIGDLAMKDLNYQHQL